MRVNATSCPPKVDHIIQCSLATRQHSPSSRALRRPFTVLSEKRGTFSRGENKLEEKDYSSNFIIHGLPIIKLQIIYFSLIFFLSLTICESDNLHTHMKLKLLWSTPTTIVAE